MTDEATHAGSTPGKDRVFSTPPGLRDMLPDELSDVTRLLAPFRLELESRDYSELHTPALEYESTIALGGLESTQPAFPLIDAEGRRLVLRSDMTIPTARVIATRLRHREPPFRLYYVSHVYRGTTGRIEQPREFLQVGAELAGLGGPDSTLELLEVLVAAVDATQLVGYRIVLGDAQLLPAILHVLEVPREDQPAITHELVTRDYVGLRKQLDRLCEQRAISAEVRQIIVETVTRRGGEDIFENLDQRIAAATDSLRQIVRNASPNVRSKLLIDFGLTRALGYYTGEVFEVHHPALGQAIGGGGRYDNLLERFDRKLPAVGFGLSVERLHEAVRADDEQRKATLLTDSEA
jgi:ATP phosphoribosyltransferase regulatory subunit